MCIIARTTSVKTTNISIIILLFNWKIPLHFTIYSTIQKFGVMFLKEVSSAQEDCIYLIKNTVNIMK